jgi:hypothetical protein
MIYTLVDKDDASKKLLKKTTKMKLKEMDQLEVEYMGQTSVEALSNGIANSSYCKIIVDTQGEPQAVFGVVDTPAGYAIPWLLTTSEHRITKEWLKHCKNVIYPEMCDERKMFTNVCFKDNHATKRWLKWLGFRFQRFDDNCDRFLMDVEGITSDKDEVYNV